MVRIFCKIRYQKIYIKRLQKLVGLIGGCQVVIIQYYRSKHGCLIKGIPVLLGEHGAYRRNNSKHVPLDLATHNDAVDFWLTYIRKQEKVNGMLPFFWDTGGALDRKIIW
jgi:hypothetical protein